MEMRRSISSWMRQRGFSGPRQSISRQVKAFLFLIFALLLTIGIFVLVYVRNQYVEVVLRPCFSQTRLHLSYGTNPVVPVKRVVGYINQTATGFLCRDSVYEYDRPVVVLMDETGKDENGLALFEAMSFPSKDKPGSQTGSWEQSVSDENSIWNTDVYVTIDDKITRNTINLSEPLKAGQSLDIYGVVRDDGSIDIGHNLQATVAVTIDWKPGGNIDVDM